MTSIKNIEQLEKIAFNAWPAEYCENQCGWILRATNGITRRANSVFPYGEFSAGDLKEAIQIVVDFYKTRDLIPRFQITPVSQPSGLDLALFDAGFTIELDTTVQTASIEKLALIPSDIRVNIYSQPNPEWLAVYAKGGELDAFSLEMRKGIIGRIASKKACASATMDGKVVGIGLGVLDHRWLGLFSLIVLSPYRRKGVATAINCALALWGMRNGAKSVYLQVVPENEPAVALYQGLGFEEQYRYWYRWLKNVE